MPPENGGLLGILPEMPDMSHNMVGLPQVDYIPDTFHHRIRATEPSTSSLPDLKPLCLSAKDNGKLMF